MLKDAQEYYKKPDVLFELVKLMKAKETTFMDLTGGKTIRCIKAHSVAYLESNFKAFNFFGSNYNIYTSLANLQNMPMFSFNYEKRLEQQSYFNKQFRDYFTGYDFALDFDGRKENPTNFKVEADFIYEKYNKYKVPFYVKPSSDDGIHFVVPSEYLDLVEDKPVNKVKIASMLCNELGKTLYAEFMDRGIYDSRRIWKTAYSVDLRSGIVSYPLDEVEYETASDKKFNFNVFHVSVLKNVDIRDRGLKLHNDLGLEEGRKNFKKFVDKYIYG